MRVSIALKKDMIAIYSNELGINITEHIKDKDLLGKRHYGVMYGVRRAVAHIKGVVESTKPDDIIVFEISNRTLVNWFKQEKANEDYEEYFNDVLEELNMLPMRYMFVYNSTVKAVKFLDSSCAKSEKLSSLEDMLNA